ncbi:MAG: hypothetical protein ACK5NY_04985 [Burkholderiaceae bacterium]|jgi:hypothetical protein
MPTWLEAALNGRKTFVGSQCCRTMAGEKLAEGIRLFVADAEKLDALLE